MTWRRENFCPYQDSNFDPSVVHSVIQPQPVAVLTAISWLLEENMTKDITEII
jgi:hypothetical protein